MLSTLPSPSSISSLSQEQQFQVLDTLFEPSPELHAITGPVLASHSFASYASLADAVRGQLSALSLSQLPMDQQTLMKILGSHPRLGRPPAKSTEHLSELSRKEQANLNASVAGDQMERLSLLNHEYEEKFPGLRFVTFVNGRNRDVIMEEMRQRIDRGDQSREIEENIQAMCDIAKDRARKLQQPANI
ncbi:hypothetical protein SI65_06815 [Aspergillus cristatus]|uniref:Oxo-4-hydroxy-4-carboxy-5-ureidoimidazoline decarboxylase domain-containing protein n=1 Tax=Aspergillus cristatus TaxID=573508 RepID=A0A1E3BAP9_ASPCR|nr:hypothetical protein SI65_06815 [Aspergillus cristatus]